MRNIMSRWVLASALGAVALTQASASIVFYFNTVHQVNFKMAPPPQRLLPGGTSTFQLFGMSTANFVGANDSAMVHIQAIPPLGDSGKIIAPEPGSLIAIGTGLVSLLGLRRRKK
jgi:hypothetical protein